MRGRSRTLCAAVFVFVVLGAGAVSAASVKVTPLGSHEGEFCKFDRAMLFEDPDSTLILYDAGRTVAGADDPRLGNIDVPLLSHMHGDHVGDRHLPAPGAGTCDNPDVSVGATPQTNTAAIALAKDAKIVTGSERPKFFSAKLKTGGGDPKNSELVRFGASRTVGGVVLKCTPTASPVISSAASSARCSMRLV